MLPEMSYMADVTTALMRVSIDAAQMENPPLPQTFGGHMRLIIGYNAKTKEILYSDSWGAGHELKRMPEDWAFAITHDAFYLKPL